MKTRGNNLERMNQNRCRSTFDFCWDLTFNLVLSVLTPGPCGKIFSSLLIRTLVSQVPYLTFLFVTYIICMQMSASLTPFLIFYSNSKINYLALSRSNSHISWRWARILLKIAISKTNLECLWGNAQCTIVSYIYSQ